MKFSFTAPAESGPTLRAPARSTQPIEQATTRLATAFSELSHRSLKANSENFLRLAEQNLNLQHEKASRSLGEREQAFESMIKPIRDSLKQSQQQISELDLENISL